MTNEDLRFMKMLKTFGLNKLIMCPEFVLSLMIPLGLFYLIFYIGQSQLNSLILELSKVIVAIDAAIIVLVITGLAILLSVLNSSFLSFINSSNLYVKFFFPFYLSSMLWGIHILFSIILIFFTYSSLVSLFPELFCLVLFIYVSCFLYALLNSLSLVGTIIRLGQKKTEFDEVLGKVDSLPN
ncbi:hypothetical protein [Desulfosporosinus sp. SB140]|uniref:hypothetical protein n=1 Tax=Desulfosporosinus paludis TaxID=3115649 RepID=UPI00388D41E8